MAIEYNTLSTAVDRGVTDPSPSNIAVDSVRGQIFGLSGIAYGAFNRDKKPVGPDYPMPVSTGGLRARPYAPAAWQAIDNIQNTSKRVYNPAGIPESPHQSALFIQADAGLNKGDEEHGFVWVPENGIIGVQLRLDTTNIYPMQVAVDGRYVTVTPPTTALSSSYLSNLTSVYTCITHTGLRRGMRFVRVEFPGSTAETRKWYWHGLVVASDGLLPELPIPDATTSPVPVPTTSTAINTVITGSQVLKTVKGFEVFNTTAGALTVTLYRSTTAFAIYSCPASGSVQIPMLGSVAPSSINIQASGAGLQYMTVGSPF